MSYMETYPAKENSRADQQADTCTGEPSSSAEKPSRPQSLRDPSPLTCILPDVSRNMCRYQTLQRLSIAKAKQELEVKMTTLALEPMSKSGPMFEPNKRHLKVNRDLQSPTGPDPNRKRKRNRNRRKLKHNNDDHNCNRRSTQG
ncbi:hypothetical protein HRR90_006680 [Exophiala dermatitidis]|uniref:Uncharacterized protein n=1 Tax=Exophiala dermatitidis TaxID=5970 RepID=A0AAN6IUY9_EXODE|nr:hypothetical protein HRR74_004630 [Exophiala dermatitidis]KAJ4521233.1 hypothetical protein HRR73_003574 [Exophiala dermatitidis]KAJ4547825.1 hypothetical protein HRR76_000448 [Exophiala dermatitidis]KAJ4553763.1 hypothetical protein HRR77_002137 [Exophiala dermatitidis]KAJ4578091.1 hypothetical protein HRR79_001409 [Exophiala dermatitidis]